MGNTPIRARSAKMAGRCKPRGWRATFTGTLSADKNHLMGIWTMGAPWHWTGPMQIDLARISQ
jgi:hypothetical protein